jgi:inorganic pyrophosphatase
MCAPIGVLKMEDEGGPDEKIIGVPTSKLTKRYDHYKDLEPGKWVAARLG